jgi:2-(1,2-epoxy-1,2-dihydrophenyl)acetyl-CoA isomerase
LLKVTFERREAVARVTLRRAEAQNAFDPGMAEDLLLAVRAADEDWDARAILLDSEGGVFCAGSDLLSFAVLGNQLPSALANMAAHANGAILALASTRKPVVCAVQGPAAGFGLGLALVADVVVGSDVSTYSVGHSAVGLTPDGGLTFMLPRLVGERRAQELVFTSRKLDAAEALALGLISRVVKAERLAETAIAIARQMAAGLTGAFGAVKQMLRMQGTLADHLEREASAIAEAVASEDGREGMRAFAERRRPGFIGR